MKRATLWLGLLAALAAAASCGKQAAPGPDVWAVVNGKEITRADVDKYYRSRVSSEGQEPSHEEAQIGRASCRERVYVLV